jgi:hypothetical protein
MRRFVIAVVVVACSPSDHATPGAPPPKIATPAPGSGSAHDPWTTPDAAPADPDEPSMVANHTRADKACPAVVAPYFYSVEKGGKKSVILGTRHIGVGLAKMPKIVKDRLIAAKLAVLETPPDKDDSDKPDTSSASLANQLGPDLWKHFVELVGKDVAANVDHMKPAVAVAGLTGIYEDPTQTLDLEIEQVAAAHHIPIQGLETNEFQDKLLDKLLDMRLLKATLSQTKDRAELEADSRDDLASYCAGIDKDPGMDPKMKQQMRTAGYTDAELAKLDDQLLYARNRDWIPKLVKILAPGDVFVAVGADHLIGPRGVIAQLAAKGFVTARIAP